MKICRYKFQGKILWGDLKDESIQELHWDQSNFEFTKTNSLVTKNEVEILLPVEPKLLLGVGDNFHKGPEDKLTPVVFEKGLHSLVPEKITVKLIPDSDNWGEPEIGVVIGNIKDPKKAILGYCLINDTTCLSHRLKHDSHSHEAKSQKGFCQMSSYFVTEFDYGSADIEGYINNKLYRKGPVSRMKWDLKRVLLEASARYDLRPFDVIFTGAPERVSPEKTYLRAGDEFRVSVEGLGELVTFYS